MGRQAAQVLVKAEVEFDPLHLAIGDSIEPCPQLVVNGQPHSIANRFLPIDRAEKVGMRAHIADEPTQRGKQQECTLFLTDFSAL